MATRSGTVGRNVDPRDTSVIVTWTGLLNGDDGAPVALPSYGEKTFQLSGTLGAGGTLQIEGSNDGVTYSTLEDKQGVAATLAALAMVSVQDRPIYVRPRISAGDGTTSLSVIMAAHRTNIAIGG